MRSPTFCIYGAGAIGGTIAAYLTRTDATVSVVARGETLAALKMHGLRLISDGQIVKAHVRVSADPSELGPQDYLIIAVKAPSLPEIASRIGPLLGPRTAVVTAMNGVPWWFFANAKGAFVRRKATNGSGSFREYRPRHPDGQGHRMRYLHGLRRRSSWSYPPFCRSAA